MAKNSTTDIELLAGLSIDSSEQEILRAIRIIEKRLKANHDARFKLNVEIDENVINNTITKLQNALKNKDLKIETQDSIQAITKEANAMLDVVDSAKKAKQEKLEFAKANQKVRNSADDTANAINRERMAMDNLDDIDVILQNLNMNGRQGNSVFQQFGATLRDAFSTYTVANLLQDAIYKVVDTGKEALDTVKKFDDINVDLQMATGADKDYVKGLISDYAELGGELGALTETVAESADTFLRQGRSIEETNQLISDAVVLSKVAKTEGEKASEILTATINGFQLAASEGSRVNDVLSSIDINSASSAEGIGEALTKVASMANNAGVSLEKTAAMIATIKDVTQDADTTIGTSLKTVLSRMNQIRAGKFIDEESGEALNDVEKVLDAIGVTMRDVNGQFKEAEAVIDEVGTKWKTLDSNTQKAVTTAMGGVYQANKLVSLFDNYDKVIELTRVAEESAGTALQKFNDSYLPSLEAKTNALKSSLQSLATTTISDEFYGSVLDSTKAIVDMTTETGILKGALAGLATAGVVYTFQHLTTYLHDATREFANLGESMQITRGATGTITDIQRLVDLTGGLSEAQTRLLLSTNNLTDAQKVAILMNQGLTQEQAEQAIATWGVATAQQGATGATITWNNALRGLFATLTSHPLLLVTAAVTAGVTAFSKYKKSQEEAVQTTKKSIEASHEQAITSEKYAESLLVLQGRLDTGTESADDLTQAFKDQLREMGKTEDEINTLIDGYGNLAKAINGVTEETLKKASDDANAARVDAAKLLESDYRGQQIDLSKDNNGLSNETFFKMQSILNSRAQQADGFFDGLLEWNAKSDDAEDIYEYYKALLDIQAEIKSEANRTGNDSLLSSDLYKHIEKRLEKLKESAESFSSALDTSMTTKAQYEVFNLLDNITTKKQFDQYIQDIKDSNEYTEEYKQTLLSVVNDAFPQFSKVVENFGSVNGENNSPLSMTSDQQKILKDYENAAKEVKEIFDNVDQYTREDLMKMDIFEGYDWSNSEETVTQSLVNLLHNVLTNTRKELGEFGDILLGDMLDTYSNAIGDEFGWYEKYTKLLEANGFYEVVKKANENGVGLSQSDINLGLTKFDLGSALIKSKDGGFTFDTDDIKSWVDDFIEAYNKAISQYSDYIGVNIGEGILSGQHLWTLLSGDVGSSNGNKATDSTFKDEIDWASQSISVLEDKVSDLETVLDNTKGWEAQVSAIDDVIKAQEALKKGHEESAKTYHDEYEKVLKGISDESVRNALRDSIESGKDFNYELYVGADKEAFVDSANSAIDFYNKSEDAKNNAIKVGIQIDEYELEKLRTEAEELSSIRDLIETQLNGELSDSEKFKKYDELETATINDFDAKINLAEKEGNHTEAGNYREQKAQALNKIEKERLNLLREQDEVETDILKHNLERLENQVELNDGEGTIEQYQEMRDLARDIYDSEVKRYEKELDLLKEIEREHGTNSYAYREQLSLVLSIASGLDTWLQKIRSFGTELLNLSFGKIDDAISSIDSQILSTESALESAQDRLDHMDSVINGAQAYIQDQIDAQEKLKKPIEEELEALEKSNDERKRALELQKARYELERAERMRTVKLYSGEEKGFIYTQDHDVVRDAQDNLADLEHNEMTHQLEKQLDYYDEIIENLREIKDAWGAVKQNAQDTLDIQTAIADIGVDGIMSMDMVAQYERNYTSTLSTISALENQLDSLNDDKNSLEELRQKLYEIAQNHLDGIIDIKEATQQMQDTTTEYREVLKEVFPDTPSSVSAQEMIDGVKEATQIENILLDAFGSTRGEIDKFVYGYNFLEESTDNIADIFENFYDGMIDKAKEFGHEFEEEFDFSNAIANTSSIEKMLNDISYSGKDSYEVTDENLQQLYDALLRDNEGFVIQIQELEDIIKKYESDAIDSANKVDETTKDMGNKVNDNLDKVDESAEDTGETLDSLGEKVDSALAKLDEIASADFVSEFAESQLKALETLASGINTTLTNMASSISSSVSGVFDSFQIQLSGVSSAISGMVAEVSASVSQIQSMQAEVSAIASNINSQYSTMQGQMSQIGEMSRQIEEASKKASETVDKMQETVTEITVKTESKPTKDKNIVKYHDGIENGLVGEKDVGEGIKNVALRKLRPDEIPALLKINEAVLTEMQQKNVMDNFGMSYKAGINSAVNNLVPVNRAAQVNIGDVNVTCTGVTSQQVQRQIGDALHKEFGNMALDALQMSGKR